MKRLAAISVLAGISMSVTAGVFDLLKEVPASQYELGKVQMEFALILVSEKLKGQKAGDTGFKVRNFHLKEEGAKLYFVSSLEGRARDMSDETCEGLNRHAASNLKFKELIREAWPGLSEEQYEELSSNEFAFSTELISTENESFKVRC